MNFPSSPELNTIYRVGSKAWRWNGVGWEMILASGGSTVLPSTSILIVDGEVRRAALTGDVIAAANSNVTSIQNGAVTLPKIAPIASNTLLGNNTGSVAAPSALTPAQIRSLLGVEEGATAGADWASNLTNIPANITSWAGIAPSSKADTSHTHAASDITSGTFANARISQSSVTQHQAALSISWSQIPDRPSIPSGTVTSIAAGNGMNFSTITGAGSVTLGTPSSITLSSTNSVTSNSHTHNFAPGGTTSQYIRGDGSLATFPTLPDLVNPVFGSTTDGTSDTKVLRVNSNGYSGIVAAGDYSNTSGEPGGAFFAATVDGSTYTGGTTLLMSMINTAGEDGKGGTWEGTVSNSALIGVIGNYRLQFGTNGVIAGYWQGANTTLNGNLSVAGLLSLSGNAAFPSTHGTGIKFWGGNDSYSIYMSGATNSTYGGRMPADTNSDYNIYYKIGSGTNRGHVFYGTSGIIGNFHGSGDLYVRSNVVCGQDGTTVGGYAGLITTASSGRSGFVAFYNASDGTRAGYVGYANSSAVSYFAEGGRSHSFNADIGSSGNILDKWGNVRHIPTTNLSGNITISQNWEGQAAVKINNTARTVTIPTHASAAIAIGTAVTFINAGNTTGNLTISAASGVSIYRSGSSGNITLTPGTSVTLVKIASNIWQA